MRVCVWGGGGGWGVQNIIVSPTFQSGDEARVRYSPIILSTELLLTFHTLSIITEVTRLNLQKKKRGEFFCDKRSVKEELPVHAHIDKQCHFDNSQS